MCVCDREREKGEESFFFYFQRVENEHAGSRNHSTVAEHSNIHLHNITQHTTDRSDTMSDIVWV